MTRVPQSHCSCVVLRRAVCEVMMKFIHSLSAVALPSCNTPTPVLGFGCCAASRHPPVCQCPTGGCCGVWLAACRSKAVLAGSEPLSGGALSPLRRGVTSDCTLPPGTSHVPRISMKRLEQLSASVKWLEAVLCSDWRLHRSCVDGRW